MLSELDDVELQDDRVSLRRAEIDESGLADLAKTYEARKHRDREKLDNMIAYAQSALCRWHLILRQFDESIEGDACGDCDNCRRNQSRDQLPAAS
jgi:ATP-dependent DNA helicase RecQ